MPTDAGAPAARKALKYKSGTHPGGGLPAADLTADQAHDWYTQAAVDEAVALGSHQIADDPPKAAAKSRSRKPPPKAAAPSDPEPADEAAPKESE